MSVVEGFDLARERLRHYTTPLALGLALSFDLGVALLERAQGAQGASDRALTGGAFGVALPLLAFFLVGRACDGASLREALAPLARHGLDRRKLTLGFVLPIGLLVAAFAVVSSALVVLLTRELRDPRLLSDLTTTAWIGLVSGLAYGTAFVGASGLGRAGRGRSWLLAVDFLLGAGDSFLAFPWPKGHVRNLLGGSAVLGFSHLEAWFALLGTSFAFLSWAALRNQR